MNVYMNLSTYASTTTNIFHMLYFDLARMDCLLFLVIARNRPSLLVYYNYYTVSVYVNV